jgi:hypothetical protein
MPKRASVSLTRAPKALFGALRALGALSAALIILFALSQYWIGAPFAPAPGGRTG